MYSCVFSLSVLYALFLFALQFLLILVSKIRRGVVSERIVRFLGKKNIYSTLSAFRVVYSIGFHVRLDSGICAFSLEFEELENGCW